ncbi:MAG: YgiQ family radical SAM protein [Synergistaceae bacterium]|nr:YgiQ family radical SAM protein [Synergistaceae bacterium]
MQKENKIRLSFLPTTREDLKQRNIPQLDVLIITGDAYVDHPSFGHAIIARLVESLGFTVGIISQPDWHKNDDFTKLGRPRLCVMLSAGNMDSMVNHYTANKKKRHNDNYTPGGIAGKRPDRATMVYCNKVRENFGDIPLIIGGIEASLRRLAHYDYWSDKVRGSILVDSRADLLVYGMGELATKEILTRLDSGENIKNITNIDGTCYKTHDISKLNCITLPSFSEVSSDKNKYAMAFASAYKENDSFNGKKLAQDQGTWFVVQNKPARPLTQSEMDEVYALPYTRKWHPDYDKLGGVPALSEVKFSVTQHRGCFGECAFCAIASHQGRIIQSRSDESVLKEIEAMTHDPDFKGYVSDLGGPTADFTHTQCEKCAKYGSCRDKSCLYPVPCENLNTSHEHYISLLEKAKKIPKIKKIFIRSGLRFDYILAENNSKFLEYICENNVSGQLKIAPEHISTKVLNLMRKPQKEIFEKFIMAYKNINNKLGKKQFLVPYFISSHPGSTLEDAIELAEFIRDTGLRPEQVQDFTPTPGSVSTCMYYTGINPFKNELIYVAKSMEERKMQRALLQYFIPENKDLVKKALMKVKRYDLIGAGKKCLVR